MGVAKYIGNKLLSFILFGVGLSFGFAGSSLHNSTLQNISVIVAIIFIIASVYYWKHSPF